MANAVLKAVALTTGTRQNDWELMNGPDSRCGVDYWLRHKQTGQQVYANEDQGTISVQVLGDDQD